MTNWIEVKAHFEEAPPDWSLYAEVFDRHGIEETLEEDFPPSLGGYMEDVEGAFQRAKDLEADLLRHGANTVTIKPIAGEDWLENWKQFFKQRRVGRFVICPSWEKCEPAEGEIVLDLDPGQAFGTGDHPTTRLCLDLMQDHPWAGKRVHDIGCGSGILSIAACKLGASPVIGIDIDAQSVQITKDNAKANAVEMEAYLPDEWQPDGKADAVLSNIISATLVRLAPDVHQSIKPQGIWIVSGIILQNWDLVREAAEKLGFVLERKEVEGEWIGATFRR